MESHENLLSSMIKYVWAHSSVDLVRVITAQEMHECHIYVMSRKHGYTTSIPFLTYSIISSAPSAKIFLETWKALYQRSTLG